MKQSKFLNHIILCLLVIGISSYAFIYNTGFEEDNLRVLIRFSAQLAVIFFTIAFGSSAINYFVNNKLTASLVRYRPMIGLTFFSFHFAHLIFLFLLQYWFHPVFTLAKTSSLAAGGLAYFFIFAMTITTFPSVKSKMPRSNWKILHTIGSYWIWIIFFNSYLKNVINKERYYFFFTLLLFVLVLRIAKIIHLKISSNKLEESEI